ncbi:hypothetical protein PsYK624_046920 [Phanerochaete sordida]|uniref:Transmembrane protein n=1 Tax=Phanerochaete sordida TaxID=48140 RepID=A0A9P3G6Z4_9APHY|nr:hypothetical protein PsYK624_046920 [Phanerochaete sordida]
MFSKFAPLGALAIALFQARSAFAQGTNATCSSQYSWMDNSRDQNPCLIAAYLNSACLADPIDAYVYALPKDYHYRPPTSELATSCQCSTVFYSMLAACATCQDRSNVRWSTWQTNCSTDYISVWPVNIPPGTSVPAWAYLDVRTPDTFNATAAQAIAAQDPPESSATPTPTPSVWFSAPASAAASTTTSDTTTALPPPSPQPTGTTPTEVASTGSNTKSNSGAIAGGVVGGICGAAIVAGFITYFVLKSRSRKTCPSQAYIKSTASAPAAFTPRGARAAYVEKPPLSPAQAYVAQISVRAPVPQPAARLSPGDRATFAQTGGSPVFASVDGSCSPGNTPSRQFGPYSQASSPTENVRSNFAAGYTGAAEV